MGIGVQIKKARENKGWTRDDLAREVGVSRSAISNYENEISHPKEQIIYKLFAALNVDANYLFQEEISKLNANASPQTLEEAELKDKILDSFSKANLEGKRQIADQAEQVVAVKKYQAGREADTVSA